MSNSRTPFLPGKVKKKENTVQLKGMYGLAKEEDDTFYRKVATGLVMSITETVTLLLSITCI